MCGSLDKLYWGRRSAHVALGGRNCVLKQMPTDCTGRGAYRFVDSVTNPFVE